MGANISCLLTSVLWIKSYTVSSDITVNSPCSIKKKGGNEICVTALSAYVCSYKEKTKNISHFYSFTGGRCSNWVHHGAFCMMSNKGCCWRSLCWAVVWDINTRSLPSEAVPQPARRCCFETMQTSELKSHEKRLALLKATDGLVVLAVRTPGP